MTDKQIIIDKCNVSECKYFNGYQRMVRNNECIVDMQNACIEEIKTKPCQQKHNCYYKQLKRKEQECDELKKANEEKNELLMKLGCPTTATAKRKVLYLEKELEKIKEINNEIKTDLKNWGERFKLQNAFIDNLLEATNNSIWIDKSISDEEASEIIEKIEMDYVEFEEGKEIYEELKAENENLKQTLAEIKKLVEKEFCRHPECCEFCANSNDCLNQKIIEKINEVEDDNTRNI